MKQRYRRWRMKRQMKRAVALLIKADQTMIDLNFSRQLRRQIWRDFVRSPKMRMNILNVLNVRQA